MIRINLLAVERERSKKVRVLIPPAHRVTVGASLILLVTVLGIGWWFWMLRSESLAIDAEMVRAEGEMQKLRHVLAEVQKRRQWPTEMTQALQLLVQKRIISNVLALQRRPSAPFAVKLLNWFPMLRRLPARLIGMGFRPEHVRSLDIKP